MVWRRSPGATRAESIGVLASSPLKRAAFRMKRCPRRIWCSLISTGMVVGREPSSILGYGDPSCALQSIFRNRRVPIPFCRGDRLGLPRRSIPPSGQRTQILLRIRSVHPSLEQRRDRGGIHEKHRVSYCKNVRRDSPSRHSGGTCSGTRPLHMGGKNAAQAVENSVILEEVAKIALNTLTLIQ